jgi:hypothetical protein
VDPKHLLRIFDGTRRLYRQWKTGAASVDLAGHPEGDFLGDWVLMERMAKRFPGRS